MTERQTEDLIAQFPDESFRGHGLVLKGRQQSFAKVGRFDLVDSFQASVWLELKARAREIRRCLPTRKVQGNTQSKRPAEHHPACFP